MSLFEALAELLEYAVEELPSDEEAPQQFTREPIEGWGIAIHIGSIIVEMVEYFDKATVMCGGVHYAEGYDFYDCACKRCQQLNAIHEKRLATMRTS